MISLSLDVIYYLALLPRIKSLSFSLANSPQMGGALLLAVGTDYLPFFSLEKIGGHDQFDRF